MADFFGVQTTGIIYLGEDPVSGRYRYYNLDTNSGSFSDTAPTAPQLTRYKEEQARQAQQEAAQEKPPSRSAADTIEKQAKVTAIANGYVSKSNDVISTAEVVVSRATPVRDTAIRFGDAYNTPEKSLANASNKSALITQKVAIDKQIIANNDFLTKFAQSGDPAIKNARQQIQTSTLQLQTSRAKIDETLATIDGASTQIQATAAPAAPTQDTAQRDVANTTSPATAAPTTLSMPELSKLVKNKSTPGGDRGVIPNVIDKTEPGTDNNKSPLATQGTLSGKPWTGPIPNPDAVDLSKVLPNTLLQYASYTYGLSLHLLSAEEYNKVVEKGEFVPNRVLIASAGRYNNTPGPSQFIRSPKFKEDFYFDGLNLETLVSPNAISRNSNAIKYDFSLIEPYGFTLLDRIINISYELECENYLDMPYMLQIDFFGIDDAGEIIGAIPNTTKHIPIRLNKMDVKVTARGTEYRIEGVPYHHSAFDITTVSTPATFEVAAKNVGQFFQSDETAGDTTDITSQRESSQGSLYLRNDGRLVGPEGQIVPVNTLNQSLLSIKTKRELGLIKSFGTALNNFQKSLYDSRKIGVNDTYVFNFIDPEIADSPFTEGLGAENITPKDTGMTDIRFLNAIKKSDLGFNTNSYDPNQHILQINAGTHIDRVISYVIRHSKWMTDQVVIPDGVLDPEKYLTDLAAKKDQPFKWIKIIPSIKLGEFDRIRKIWSRTITYHIQKYEIRNLKVNIGPGATAKNPVKSYSYTYTGKNIDVLDLDIKFNFTYYNAFSVNRSSLTNVVPIANPNLETQTANPQGWYQSEQDANAVMPMVMKPQIMDTGSRASGRAITPKQVAITEAEASLMTNSLADMLVVKLRILGDPSFIKQDDVFWTPKSNTQVSENKNNADPRLTPDGSLKMDNGMVYVNLTFRTPIDIDESTGLMKFDSPEFKTNVSLFSGLYFITIITNEFRNGQFTQVLELNRLTRQGKLDHTTNKAPTSDNRNILLGQTVQMNDYMQGPNFNIPDRPKIAQAVDDAAQSAQQAQENNRDNADPNVRTSEEDGLVETRALAPEEPISETNLLTSVPPGPSPSSPTAAQPGSVFDGISASDLQYIRSQSAALGLNPSALNGYLTNRLQDYQPNLRAKVAADVVKLKEILRKRNQ